MLNVKNAKQYIQRFLKIKTKNNEIVPFKLNEPQKRLYEVIRKEARADRPIRIIILKARQMGFSTLTEALIFHRTATKKNVNSLIIAHKDDATSNLFNMSKLFYNELPPMLKPKRKASNARELIFDAPVRDEDSRGLNSKIKCATAGGDGVGRSDTFSNVHISEFAFWSGNKMETLNGLLQSVPSTAGTMVIVESTANGFDEFKRLWDAAVNKENDFVPVFFPWFELSEYSKPYDGFELTEEEKEIKQRYNLTLDQLTWRRWCIKNNCGGDVNLFKQEYPASPEEAFIATGACVFDTEKIINRINELKDFRPAKEGLFLYDYDGSNISSVRFDERERGCIKIFRQPEERKPYVIGGDTAGEGSDYFTAHVIDNTTGEQVAVLRSDKMDEDEYTRQIFCLGMYYNNALVGIEANFSTFPIRELSRIGYHKQYVRETPDTFTGAIKKAFGFKTTTVTRPVIIAKLVQIVREEAYLINDVRTLREMLSFVRIKGKPRAEEGEHDDLVMGLAITYGIREQQAMTIETGKQKKIHWEPDQWEDYYNSNSEGRKELIKKWGNPF